MICPRCGKEIEDGAKFCSYCGSEIGNYSIHYEKENVQEGKAIGICSIVFAVLSPIVGLILGIVGRNVYKKEENIRLAKIGLYLSITFIVIEFIVLLFYVPFVIKMVTEIMSSVLDSMPY